MFKGLDWMLTKEGQLLVNFGIEGTHWNYNADKKIEKTPDFVKRAQNDWNKEAHEGVGYYQQLALYPPAYLDLLPDSVRYPRPNSKLNEQNQQSIWSVANWPDTLKKMGWDAIVKPYGFGERCEFAVVKSMRYFIYFF